MRKPQDSNQGRFFVPGTQPTRPDPYWHFYNRAAAGWCWCLLQEDDGRWSLRHRYWLTDTMSEPTAISPTPLAFRDAIEWAKTQDVKLSQWYGDDTVQTDSAYQTFQRAMKTLARSRAA